MQPKLKLNVINTFQVGDYLNIFHFCLPNYKFQLSNTISQQILWWSYIDYDYETIQVHIRLPFKSLLYNSYGLLSASI